MTALVWAEWRTTAVLIPVSSCTTRGVVRRATFFGSVIMKVSPVASDWLMHISVAMCVGVAERQASIMKDCAKFSASGKSGSCSQQRVANVGGNEIPVCSLSNSLVNLAVDL